MFKSYSNLPEWHMSHSRNKLKIIRCFEYTIYREKNPEGTSVLDDKTDLDGMKDLYSKYGSEYVESMYSTTNDNEYEDEYDDTYDFNLIGADDADSADELTVRR